MYLGYSGKNYWTGGSNLYATDKFATDAWKFSNGDLVPMSTDYWQYGQPDVPNTQNCVVMMAFTSYKWHDRFCNDGVEFICEQ